MTDLKQMIKALSDRGLSHTQIAEKCGCTQSTISRVSKGQETKYRVGKAIESLYRDICEVFDGDAAA